VRADTRCPRARKAFTHYPEIIDELIKQGRVVGSRVDFAVGVLAI
jgi:hypothetical protein